MLYGALEAGGTKMICSIGDENATILQRVSYPTTTPDETMPQMLNFFRNKGISALGIGSFGPLDLHPESKTFGYITTTPKQGWQHYPLQEAFQKELSIPVAIDTDVNAAALAEVIKGSAKGLDSCLYVTVGTGIGGGLMIDGKPVHGLVHPELGHMLLQAHLQDPTPEGFCPYHKGCLEGLSSGPSLEKRWGAKASTLPADHMAWEIEAYYLTQMCVNSIVCFSPQKIILGGGVMQQTHLFSRIHQLTKQLLNGYINSPMVTERIHEYITAPGLGVNSGAVGALLLAININQ